MRQIRKNSNDHTEDVKISTVVISFVITHQAHVHTFSVKILIVVLNSVTVVISFVEAANWVTLNVKLTTNVILFVEGVNWTSHFHTAIVKFSIFMIFYVEAVNLTWRFHASDVKFSPQWSILEHSSLVLNKEWTKKHCYISIFFSYRNTFP